MKKILFIIGAVALLMGAKSLDAFPISNGFAPAIVQGETAVIVQWFHLNGYVDRDSPNYYAFDFTYRLDLIASAGVYAINKNIGVYLFIPWTHQQAKFNNLFTSSPRRITNKTSGWGDLSVSAFFRPWQAVGKGWYASMLIQPGLQFPTGDWNQKYLGVTMDRELQPGTGNWSPFLSTVVSISGTENEASLQLQYQHFFKQHDFRHGQLFTYNASVGHRIIPWFLKSGQHRVWTYLNIEFLGQYKSRPSGGPNFVNTWSNWGRLSPSLSIEIADIMKTFNIEIGFAFQQTIYYQTGNQVPVRPVRAYIARLEANW